MTGRDRRGGRAPRRRVALLAFGGLALAVATGSPQARAGRTGAGDPANIVGTWSYRTRSNCGPVEGVGEVSFAWNSTAGTYEERGFVYWSHSGRTIRWWGTVRFVPATRRLEGRIQNSLGDAVDAHWQLEGSGPDRLTVRWSQTNGCRGQGVATRAP